MSYQQSPIVEVTIVDLSLDLENYRLPNRPDDEKAALARLFESEDVMDTARLILRNGYFDNEIPLVVKEDGTTIVLEGNRRVSALKALTNPDVAPEAYQRELRGLLKRFAAEAQNLPETIRVMVAVDRATAAPHIARLHTGLPKRAWSRDQQANFYYSLLSPTTNVAAIKALYPDVEVVRFIKMASVRRFLSGVKFQRKDLHEYVTGPRLAMSAFEYAYRQKDVAAAVGLVFDADGHITPAGTSPEAIGARLSGDPLAALERLVVGFESGDLNTRSPKLKKNTPEHDDFVITLSGARPPATTNASSSGSSGSPSPTQGGTSSPAPADGTPAAPVDAAATSTLRGPNHPDTKDHLDLAGISYANAPDNLQRRYQELRKLSLSATPTATAMMLRSVLEGTIKFHFEGTTTPVSGQLANIVPTLQTAYGQEKHLKQPMGRLVSGNADVAGSVTWFNLATHSVDSLVNEAEVRAAWQVVNPILRHLLH